MCQKSSEYFELDEAESKMQSSSVKICVVPTGGNGIAVPHPLTAVSSDSFVAVTELPQAVVWDDQKNMVNLVLMVCVGKKQFQGFSVVELSGQSIFRQALCGTSASGSEL